MLRIVAPFSRVSKQLSIVANSSRFYGSSKNCEGLNVTTAKHVCRVEFSRPWKYNAITTEMYHEIPRILEEASKNDDIKFVVFAGTGSYYCSGHDLSNFEKAAAKIGKEKMVEESIKICTKFVTSLIDFDKPLIACVNGPAIGVGVTTLALFDLVWASDSATFNAPFVSLGQSAEATSTYTFPYLMGHAKASEFLLFGRKLTAVEAYERNLVNEVFPATSFFDECNRRISEYAKLP
uniref:Uncharacterized protein n=1 Tax=Panagrolaimus sp. ES5 TaxID=591445 RepID=A0AC34GAQ6_9BILA